jgi:MFS family permease
MLALFDNALTKQIDSPNESITSRLQSRIAISALFLLHGLIIATWASRIGDIQHLHRLNSAELGWILLAPTTGALLGFPCAGYLTARYNLRFVVTLFGVLFASTLVLVSLSSNTYWLVTVLIFFGIVGNIFSIALNTYGVLLERQYSVPVFSSLHAMFSIGGILGAGLGGIFISSSSGLLSHFGVVTAFCLLTYLFCASGLFFAYAESSATKFFVVPSKSVFILGLIACCALLCEGAIADWSSIYFNETIQSKYWVTAGYTSFSACMALGRLSGDRLLVYFGRARMIIYSAMVAIVGITSALLIADPILMTLGFALVGLGFSSIVPAIYSAAGKSNTMSAGDAIMAVTSIGFVGLFLGPTLIGYLAEMLTLQQSLFIIPLMLFVIIFLTRVAFAKT